MRPDALFYGTGFAEVVTAPAGIRQYFAAALNANRGTVKATPFTQTALLLSDTIVAISGKWQWKRTLDGQMVTACPLRNTVVTQTRGDQWLIVQFHNYLTPKPNPPATQPPCAGTAVAICGRKVNPAKRD
ncbi:MAG: hypothetical protein NVS3B2_09340 [Ramlibacter sp.]